MAPGPSTPEVRVLDAFEKTLNACRLLVTGARAGRALSYRRGVRASAGSPDRAHHRRGFAALKGALEPVITGLYGDSARIERTGDKGSPLMACIQAQSPASIGDPLGRL
jgi:hypothetical protein